MSAINRILIKVIVKRYYEQSAGLLLVVFFVMFGMVESSQVIYYHLSLMHAMLQGIGFLTIVSVVWLIYLLRALSLVRHNLALPENEFLQILRARTPAQQYWHSTLCIVLIMLPVLLYGGLTIGLGVQEKHFTEAFVITLILLILVLAGTIASVFFIHHPHLRVSPLAAMPSVRLSSYTGIFLKHIAHNLSLAWLITKVSSLLLLFGFLQIETDHYDSRPALLGFLFGLVAHAYMLFEFRRFENTQLVFLRNFPWSVTRRALQEASVYLLLLLPEVLMLLSNLINVPDALLAWMLGTMFFLALGRLAEATRLDMERYLIRIFWIFMLTFLFILAGLTTVMALAFLLYSVWEYRKYRHADLIEHIST